MLTHMGNETETQAPVQAPPPDPSKRVGLWIGLAAAAGLVVGAVGTLGIGAIANSIGEAVSEASADTRLADAVDDCRAGFGTELADGDQTLTIDVKGDEDETGASYSDLACILEELEAPASAWSHIEQTTSMDGRQEESWDGITIAWSYHPDRGSDMVITLEGE